MACVLLVQLTGLDTYNRNIPWWLKVVWGVSIVVMTWILISFAGIDGIKSASNLGGFPNMFLMLIMIVALLKICKNLKKYDLHKEDYDSHGAPIVSKRLSIVEEE